MTPPENKTCQTLSEVHEDELKLAIRKRREYWNNLAAKSGDGSSQYPGPSSDDLVGLSLSGGGIRSAMYNLGLLQAFEESGLMKHVDYMASVSGGGYANGFYSLHQANRSGPLNRDEALKQEGDDADVVPGATNALPGTSAQVQKSQPKMAASSTEILRRSKRLSICTEKFLLHGQYLNRPMEIVTSYILRTIGMAAAVISLVVAFAAIIAIIFRFFDEPAVRIRLGLLDLNTDLRVGLFSCAVVALAVLVVRRVVLSWMGIRQRALRTSPGRPALILIGTFLLGISIMIGNGDFNISQGSGWLPQSLDLKSLQWPIVILVALAFSPLLRLPSLLRSERANATVWQKMALSLVLCCTTWGAIFALVGFIGRENVSGFVTRRPPKLVAQDIKNYPELAALLAAPNANSGDSTDRDGLRWLIKNDLKRVNDASSSILALEKQRAAAEQILRNEELMWHSWYELYNATLSRYVQVLGATILPTRSNVQDVIESSHEILQQGKVLVAALNESLSNGMETDISKAEVRKVVGAATSGTATSGTATSGTATNNSSVVRNASQPTTTDAANKSMELLKLVARRIALQPKEVNDIELSSIRKAGINSTWTENDTHSVINAWIAKGGKLLVKGGARYKDLDGFQSLLEKAFRGQSGLDFSSFTDLELWTFNRMCLEVAYPRVFKERVMVSTPVVVREDQWFRSLIAGWAIVIHLLCLALVDMNWTCAWFHFYKSRVHATFLQHGSNNVVPLDALNPHHHGAPYPLFVAGMMLPQVPSYIDGFSSDVDSGNPSKLDGSYASDWYSFVFSPLYCGWLPCRKRNLATYLPTSKFWDRKVGVEDAVVLSGAAVTPWMSNNTSLQFLLHLFNFRLEQWLPNTMLPQPPNRRFSLIDMAREFWNGRLIATAQCPTEKCRYVVVADGGFREFLGVEELIARRCRIIIVSDAGCNNGLFEFGVLADLIRKLRLDHGVQVLDLDHERPLDTRRLRRTEELDNKSPQHFVLGRIRYPEHQKLDDHLVPKEALLVYVQMSLTGDEDIDIEQFRKTNPNFPDEPISNQFYSREQVESFRQLGEHIGRLLARDISDFDCTGNAASQVGGTHADQNGSAKSEHPTRLSLQQERIRRLEDSFRFSYRNECRQEGSIADDDARIGWLLDKQVGGETLAAVHAYESDSNHRRQLAIRDYVWSVLDAVSTDKDYKIQPADLYGIAVECNRRHAGFRPEWPTSFFQIGGRDLLIKAAQIAHETFGGLAKGEDEDFNTWCKGLMEDASRPPLPIQKLCRLAVMLPRGVFRKSGCRTSAEVLVCMLALAVLPARDFETETMQWITSEKAQASLRAAIRTGKAREVEKVINELVKYQVTPQPTKVAAATRSPRSTKTSDQ